MGEETITVCKEMCCELPIDIVLYQGIYTSTAGRYETSYVMIMIKGFSQHHQIHFTLFVTLYIHNRISFFSCDVSFALLASELSLLIIVGNVATVLVMPDLDLLILPRLPRDWG